MQRRRFEPAMNLLQKYWAILAVAAGCLITWGSTAERMISMKDEIRDLQAVTKADHDTVVEIRTEQRTLIKKVDKLDEKLDSVLRAVKEH